MNGKKGIKNNTKLLEENKSVQFYNKAVTLKYVNSFHLLTIHKIKEHKRYKQP